MLQAHLVFFCDVFPAKIDLRGYSFICYDMYDTLGSARFYELYKVASRMILFLSLRFSLGETVASRTLKQRTNTHKYRQDEHESYEGLDRCAYSDISSVLFNGLRR